MRSLDEFYKYIAKQEQALRAQESAAASSAASAVAAAVSTVDSSEPAHHRDATEPEPALTAASDADGNRSEAGTLAAAAATSAPPVASGPASFAPPTPAIPGRARLRGYEKVLPPEALRAAPPIAPARKTNEVPAEQASGEADVVMTALDYLPPLIEADPPLVVDAPARPRHLRRGETNRVAAQTRRPADGVTLARPLPENEAAALWRRLPRHVQLLIGMELNAEQQQEKPEEKSAQKDYLRGFKETRTQLIERLLDPTLSLEDTGRILGVCPTTVRRYTNRGILPHHRTVGQQRRFRLSDVLAFLENSRSAGGGGGDAS